ncbi:hypothetical protein PHYBLDRAFT_72204 [Phycomyces blakesleeanus NRRL 1555(-)]|uniref:Homeodomain-like DNA binding domain-containing transcription factor n=1 Tax=Phycomyces blakesleeanus (strain ATCC 8743b / DSM 1359 / FGSC 10004 / NBRC 33097 / NRRL 1555) TaxID=763407 RepID=A0A162U502_PHYB8|nr:hypothetical protein PHYBLDRAFT_72204 [Phycomyces blakesleeanus NRRL 1555(-)]OAD73472.1 hypothetical protein PHYBLDRAFT_72204 [Phycomyces blakesleeanus NRRL 1555(-)]|eukprot:XP_018291512.1 hypothetical protein PHYBLDRAFT_72204 [Phycomyces blakesleeanus NRRL 1555(-)]
MLGFPTRYVEKSPWEIKCFDQWPYQSPDLNPMESVYHALKLIRKTKSSSYSVEFFKRFSIKNLTRSSIQDYWKSRYLTVISLLSVAAEPLKNRILTRLVGLSVPEVRNAVVDLKVGTTRLIKAEADPRLQLQLVTFARNSSHRQEFSSLITISVVRKLLF